MKLVVLLLIKNPVTMRSVTKLTSFDLNYLINSVRLFCISVRFIWELLNLQMIVAEP